MKTALKSATPDQSKAFGIERGYVNGTLVLNGEQLDETAFAAAGRAMRVSPRAVSRKAGRRRP